MKTDPVEHIKNIAQPLVSQTDMFLIDVEIKQQDMNVVWVYVDSEKGDVNIDECTKLSRELSFLIETDDVFKKSYRLNVSTPGLSRPLSDIRQYTKNTGRSAKVKYRSEEGYEKIEGVLKDASEDFVKIEIDEGIEKIIPFDDVVETKIVPKI